MKIASEVGSATASAENDVRRFSRLLPAHVYELPLSFTIVPNSGFAMTFDHGTGVPSSSPVTTRYSRPSAEKPPTPFQNCVGGIAGSDAAPRRTAGFDRARRRSPHVSW